MAYTGFLKDVTTEELKKNLKMFDKPGQGKDIKAELAYRGELPTPKAPTVPTKTVTPVQTPQAPSAADLIKQLEERRLASTKSALKGKLEGTLSALAGEREKVAPAFREARTGVRTQDVMQREAARKGLEGRGLIGSGAEQQRGIAQDVTTMSAISGLRGQEAERMADIARQESAAKKAYETDIASAEAGIQADTLSQLIADRRAQEARELQMAGLTGDIGGQRTLAGQQFDISKEQTDINRELAEKEQAFDRDLQTIGRYSQDYQAEIDRRSALDPSDPMIPYLQAARQLKIQGLSEAEAQRQLQAQAQEAKAFEQQYENAFNLWRQLGTATQEIASVLGIPVGSRTNDAAYRDAQLQLNRIKESRLGAKATTTPKKISKGEVWTTWDNIQDNDPTRIAQWLDANAEVIVNSIGRNGYEEMLAENNARLETQADIDERMRESGGTLGR